MSEKEDRKQILDLTAKYYRNYLDKNGKVDLKNIRYAGRVFDEKEMVNLVDSSLDFWLTAGRYYQQFEKSLAQYMGVRFAYFVNSGSSANLLAFMALTDPRLGERAIKRGDEVITVACGFPTTVTPILNFGAVPVFLDVTIPQYNIDTSKLEAALSPKTKAVFIAHTLGNPFDIEKVKGFCDKHHLWLIEDNCDAMGSKVMFHGQLRLTGTIGDIGTSSFYPAHHMTTGEGGAVYTNNPILARTIKSLRDWGRDCVCPSGKDNTCGHRFDGDYGTLPHGYDHKYVYSTFGYNLEASEMQAAVGCAQIEKLPQFVQIRRHNHYRLLKDLASIQDKIILPEPLPGSEPSWFGFTIFVKEPYSRNDISGYLESKGIQTRNLFSGNLLRHPCFDGVREDPKAYRVVGNLSNTDAIMNNLFWVGVYPGMTDEVIDYMAKIIIEAFKR
jgi:CDP-6-deoxy-D-xylo-4-hexulose-3-dehydrase